MCFKCEVGAGRAGQTERIESGDQVSTGTVGANQMVDTVLEKRPVEMQLSRRSLCGKPPCRHTRLAAFTSDHDPRGDVGSWQCSRRRANFRPFAVLKQFGEIPLPRRGHL